MKAKDTPIINASKEDLAVLAGIGAHPDQIAAMNACGVSPADAANLVRKIHSVGQRMFDELTAAAAPINKTTYDIHTWLIGRLLGVQAGRYLEQVCNEVGARTCDCAFCTAMRDLVKEDMKAFDHRREVMKAMSEKPANAKLH